MPLPARFHQLDSRLDGFFAAECGCEESGAPLSVLSALTRAGVDPWSEGARLARLPRKVATRELAQLITGLAPENPLSLEVLRLSEQLVGRLPKRGTAGMVESLACGRYANFMLLWPAGLLLALGALLCMALLHDG